MAQWISIEHPKTGIVHKFQSFPKVEVKRYWVVLKDRSVHPTIYNCLQNATIAFKYLNR
jgi:hypothetical protein